MEPPEAATSGMPLSNDPSDFVFRRVVPSARTGLTIIHCANHLLRSER